MVASPVDAGPKPTHTDVVGKVIQLLTDQGAGLRSEGRMREQSRQRRIRRRLFGSEEKVEDFARRPRIGAVAGWVCGMSWGTGVIVRVLAAPVGPSIWAQIIGWIQFVRAIEQNIQILKPINASRIFRWSFAI